MRIIKFYLVRWDLKNKYLDNKSNKLLKVKEPLLKLEIAIFIKMNKIIENQLNLIQII